MLTGAVPDTSDPTDVRWTFPRFQGHNLERNLDAVTLIGQVAAARDATPLIGPLPSDTERSSPRPRRRADDVPGAVVRTRRLNGRPPRQADVDELTAMLNDSAVAPWLGGTRTREAVQASVTTIRRSWLRRGWSTWTFRTEQGELAGRAGLAPATVLSVSEVELMYTVPAPSWGRGYATEMSRAAVDLAFTTAGIASLVAFTLKDNARSRAVMEKVGFRYVTDIEHADLPHVLYRLDRETRSSRLSGCR